MARWVTSRAPRGEDRFITTLSPHRSVMKWTLAERRRRCFRALSMLNADIKYRCRTGLHSKTQARIQCYIEISGDATEYLLLFVTELLHLSFLTTVFSCSVWLPREMCRQTAGKLCLFHSFSCSTFEHAYSFHRRITQFCNRLNFFITGATNVSFFMALHRGARFSSQRSFLFTAGNMPTCK